MNHSEAGKLSRISQEETARKIEEYAAQYRPKKIASYEENGHKVNVYSAAWADGAKYYDRVK